MTETQIRNTVYRTRPPRRSINYVRIVWIIAVVSCVALVITGKAIGWKW